LRENLRVNQELEDDQQDRERAKLEGRLEGIQEGRREGIIDGEQRLIIRLLNRRIGEIDPSLTERIRGLSLEQLENLGEALLKFSNIADLEAWLNQQER
jgi:predicted transposase YdaD